MDVGKLLFRTESDDGLLMTVAEPGAMCKYVRPDTVQVIMLNMLTDVLGDDRFSPGVPCCVTLNRLSCIVPPRNEPWKHLEFDWTSSVDCMTDWWVQIGSPCEKAAFVWCFDVTSIRHGDSIGYIRHDIGLQ